MTTKKRKCRVCNGTGIVLTTNGRHHWVEPCPISAMNREQRKEGSDE
jgi:hypothetical protein